MEEKVIPIRGYRNRGQKIRRTQPANWQNPEQFARAKKAAQTLIAKLNEVNRLPVDKRKAAIETLPTTYGVKYEFVNQRKAAAKVRYDPKNEASNLVVMKFPNGAEYPPLEPNTSPEYRPI